jgi:hypothetical protein
VTRTCEEETSDGILYDKYTMSSCLSIRETDQRRDTSSPIVAMRVRSFDPAIDIFECLDRMDSVVGEARAIGNWSDSIVRAVH